MEDASHQVSVIEPLGPAMDRVKTLLFRPFEIERWLAIALCAWLALLGTGGGASTGKGVRYSREEGFTCFCACCLMALPFIGTALLLPIHVFKRSYSLLYLRQYGPAFDGFAVYPPAIPKPPLE